LPSGKLKIILLDRQDNPRMPRMQQESKYNSKAKRAARINNIKIYELLNKRNKLNCNEKYVTLSSRQDNSKNSEINQIVEIEFLKKPQYVGIDNDKDLIRENNKNHPEATWIADDWCCALQHIDFSGGLVYFDSTYFSNKSFAVSSLRTTLEFADYPETLVVGNFMLTNPYVGNGNNVFNPNVLIDSLFNDNPAKWRNWNQNFEYVPNYEYKTTKTLMRSYIFYNGVLTDDLVEEINSLTDNLAEEIN